MKRFIVLVFLAASLSALGAGVELRPQAIETCTSCRMLWADFNGDGLDDVIEGKGLQFNLGGRFGPRIAVSRIHTVGKGEGEPLTANPFDQTNRRVQFARAN